MNPSISEADFEILVAQSGLPLSQEQKSTIYGAYAMLERMIARVNTPLPREAEPAHIFIPELR